MGVTDLDAIEVAVQIRRDTGRAISPAILDLAAEVLGESHWPSATKQIIADLLARMR